MTIIGLAHASRPLVLLASPYAPKGERTLEMNMVYARAAMLDSITKHNEAPFASHLLYTQVLDDTIPDARELGLGMELAVSLQCNYLVMYVDHGVSSGMINAANFMAKQGKPIIHRTIL